MDFNSIKTIPDLFYQSTSRYSKRNSLSFVHEKPFTYTEVYRNSNYVSSLLKDDGFKIGQKVAILSENSPFWGMIYFGISITGGIMVPILPDFQKNEVENILDHAEVSHVFVSAKQYTKVADLNNKYNIVQIDDIFKDLSVEASTDAIPAPQNLPVENDLGCIIYTSGTTGTSKGVMLSHKNIISNVLDCKHIPPLRSHDRALSVLPLAHTYECTLGLLVPFLRGAAIYYLTKPPSTSVLLPALKKVRPGMMLTVPLLMEKIYSGIKTTKVDKNKFLSFLYKRSFTRRLANILIGISLKKTFGGRLNFYGIGGAPLSEETERFLRQARFPYAIGYGLTETAPLLAGDNAKDTKFRATGRFLKHIEYKLDHSQGTDGSGELLVRGPNIMIGYYKEL